MANERRVFVAVNDLGEVQLGGQWALAEIKGPAHNDQVTVGGSVAEIAAANLGRKSFMLFNFDATATLYVGPDNTVTTVNGWPVPPGAIFIDNISNSAWFGVSDSGNIDVRTLEVSTEDSAT